ncbi:hypothetical protein KQI63_15840 [bacterium]|nr:hypothetical protein [bacterium]
MILPTLTFAVVLKAPGVTLITRNAFDTQAEEDLVDVFFDSTDGFAESVVFTRADGRTVTTSGIFDDNPLEMDLGQDAVVDGDTSVLMVRARSVVPAITSTDKVRIRGALYRVVSAPIRHGVAECRLVKV